MFESRRVVCSVVYIVWFTLAIVCTFLVSIALVSTLLVCTISLCHWFSVPGLFTPLIFYLPFCIEKMSICAAFIKTLPHYNRILAQCGMKVSAVFSEFASCPMHILSSKPLVPVAWFLMCIFTLCTFNSVRTFSLNQKWTYFLLLWFTFCTFLLPCPSLFLLLYFLPVVCTFFFIRVRVIRRALITWRTSNFLFLIIFHSRILCKFLLISFDACMT